MFFSHLADVLVAALTAQPEWATFMALASEPYNFVGKKNLEMESQQGLTDGT